MARKTPADDEASESSQPRMRKAGGSARTARTRTSSESLRLAGLASAKEMMDIEFVRSMRSISSWIHGVAHSADGAPLAA